MSKVPQIDFDSVDSRALQELVEKATAAIEEKREKERVTLREKLDAIAEKAGFTVAEVYGFGGRRRTGEEGELPAKYRDPETNETWTGRGRKPRWLQAKIEEGHTQEEFLI